MAAVAPIFRKIVDMESLVARWPIFLLVVIVLFGAALRIGVAKPDREILVGDETTYWYSAQSLLEHGTLTREVTGEMYRGEAEVRPTSALSPGYPVFIAALGVFAPDSTAAILWANVWLSIATLALVALMSHRLKLRPLAAILVVAFTAMYPGFMYSLDRMLTEQLYLALFVGFAYATVCAMESGKLWQTAVAGVVLALATHVRAQAVPFLLVAAVFLFISRPRQEVKQHLMILAGAFAIAMAPWWIRNAATFGRFIFLSEAGDGAAVWGATPYFHDMMSTSNKTLAEVVRINMPANEGVYYRWRIFGYLQFMWGDVWDEWLTHPQRPLHWPLLLHYLVVVVGVLGAPVIALIRRSPSALFIACVPLVVTVCNLPFHGLPRYAFPAVPFAIIAFGLLLSPGGSMPPAMGRTQVFMALAVRYVFVAVATVMSAALLYSLFVFPARMDDEISRYRLSRYMGTYPERLGTPFSTDHYKIEPSSIGATKLMRDGWVRNNINAPSIIHLDIPVAGEDRVVTKVTLRIEGGFPFDYTTLYWTGPKTPEITESAAYRVPSGRFIDEVTFYIDDDVTHLMFVPRVFRWGKFRINGVDVEKYRSP